MAQVEPLVMLPPMLCDARVFAPQIAELSRERVVICAPVHGAERIEEIASALLDVLPPKFAVLGMGFGGNVALELMRRAAARVSRIAIVGTSPLQETPEQAAAREPRMIAAKMGRIEDVIAQEIPTADLFEQDGRSAVMALLREMGQSLGPEAYVRQARAAQKRKDQTGVLREGDQSVMIMSGEIDPVLTPRRLAFLSELVEIAEVRTIDAAGVLPTLENPTAVSDALRDWLGAPMLLR